MADVGDAVGAWTGRVAVVTGGTGGLGVGVVAELLGQGGTCVIPVFSEAEGARFSLAGHPRVQLVPGIDLTNEASVHEFYGVISEPWASIQLVGGFMAAPIEQTTVEELERMWALNVRTTFLCAQAAIRRFRARGTGGRIVTVAARPALTPVGGLVAYAASKAAVVALTQGLAEEVKGEGILVNAVAPSIMDTPANRAAMPRADFTRWPKVDEVGRTIAWLASADNTLTSGAVVPVYGRA